MMRSGLARGLRAATKGAEVIAIALTILIVLVVIYEIVARYVFNEPTTWSQDLSVYMLLWFFFLGLAPAERAGHHIRIDILYLRFSPVARRWAGAFAYLCVTAFALLAVWSGVEMVAQSLRFGRRSLSLFSVPLWIPQLSLAVGMALLALEAVRRTWRTWRSPEGQA